MAIQKPPFPEVQRVAVAKAHKRHLAREVNPGVAVEPAPSGYRLGAPHRDKAAWEIQILDAFGTRSVSAARVFLDQLAALRRPAYGADGKWAPNEVDLNALVAMVNSVRPRNEMEAALAAQMAAIHLLTARILGEAASVEGWVNPEKAALAAKMARTFAQQCDAMNRLKGRVGKQSIKVRYERHNHQHVHIEGGAPEILGQGRALAVTRTAFRSRNSGAALGLAPLSGEDPGGFPVSGSGRDGEGQM
ncbi:MAG: hypothetical protein ACR2FH_11510 [Caulobacteraceae bacterium]